MRDSDEQRFREYAAARLGPLRRIGYLVCGDWHLAEDAVSTVMAKLYVNWHTATRADNLDAYVRRMLIRAIVDERRRPWRREHPAEYPITSAGSAGGDARTGHSDDRVVLQEALRKMPAGRRAVLVLRFFEGLSVAETAAAMGCGEGTVKSQTARGLAALRAVLPEDYLTLDGGAR